MFLASANSLELQSQTESLLKEATQLTPHSAEAHYQLGQLALQRGKLTEAEKEFRRSIASDAGKSKAYFALSVVYRRLGRAEDATTQFRIYQSLKRREENQSAVAASPAEKP
jgi:Flp pilus assembly protein TadD